jgi:hypothetical protein
MNNDVEDLLRQGMERFTAELRAPADLTRRVARRRRRRRLTRRSGAGLVTALAVGTAVLLAVVPGPAHNGGQGPMTNTAYVVKRVDSALSAAEPGEIAQMTVTTTGPTTPGYTTATVSTEEWSYGGQWRSVTYSRPGHPVYDEGSSSSSGDTLVSYLTHAWARQPGLGRTPGAAGSGSSGCEPPPGAPLPVLFGYGLPGAGVAPGEIAGVGLGSALPSTVARALRTAVSCGTLAVAGQQRVDGIEAIELASRPASPISETIWVSPGTYLPVRVVVRSGLGQPVRQSADFTWLPPTAQNLARLAVPVPAGFRHVSLVTAVGPILRQIPHGLGPAGVSVPLRPQYGHPNRIVMP